MDDLEMLEEHLNMYRLIKDDLYEIHYEDGALYDRFWRLRKQLDLMISLIKKSIVNK